uniref:Endoplasmic reticulum lectin 1 n=1 Tax=Heterorhabditis bacteriophora TaxID=37862 RepID=A0A1I7XPG9_HETBA
MIVLQYLMTTLHLFLTANINALKVDDSMHYFITFEGEKNTESKGNSLILDNEKAEKDDNILRITTNNNENYVCHLPIIREGEIGETSIYTGLSPVELLAPIYKEKVCSYRIEPYWTYELCHGRYILQYHEDKDLKGTDRTAEYYLGNMHIDYATLNSKSDQLNPPKRMVDGEEVPYFPVLYTQGTNCDVTKKPRTTTVLYICVENSRNQIHSLSEVSLCNYEIIVMTNRICSHPAYKRKEKKEHEIVCYNTDKKENPKPLSLIQMEQFHADTFKRVCSMNIWLHMDKTCKNVLQEYTITRDKPQSNEYEEKASTSEGAQGKYDDGQILKLAGKTRSESVDTLANNRLIVEDTVNRILSGKECIYGGQGWWKYEFCYGKSASFECKQTQNISILKSVALYGSILVCQPNHTNFPHLCKRRHLPRNRHTQVSKTKLINIDIIIFKEVKNFRFCEPLRYADEYGLIKLEPANLDKNSVFPV